MDITMYMCAFFLERNTFAFVQDHSFYLGCPDMLSLIGDPLSGNSCGSPYHIQF